MYVVDVSFQLCFFVFVWITDALGLFIAVRTGKPLGPGCKWKIGSKRPLNASSRSLPPPDSEQQQVFLFVAISTCRSLQPSARWIGFLPFSIDRFCCCCVCLSIRFLLILRKGLYFTVFCRYFPFCSIDFLTYHPHTPIWLFGKLPFLKRRGESGSSSSGHFSLPLPLSRWSRHSLISPDIHHFLGKGFSIS